MIMNISAKCSDMFCITTDNYEHYGYVPAELGVGNGDYVFMQIDMQTGYIIGWKPLTEDDVIAACDEDR
jgi:hypothetical protein